MGTRNRLIKPRGREAGQQVEIMQDYQEVAEQQEQIVEHLSIPGFLKRIPHRWHMEEITRFGDKVGRAAESMHLAYLTGIDRSLGTVRVFPVPLLQRVYTVMSSAMGWPTLVEFDALEDGKKADRDKLKKHERVQSILEEIASSVDDVDISQALMKVQSFVREDLEKRRKELGSGAS